MRTKIEDLVKFMVLLTDCQFIGLLAFFLHSVPKFDSVNATDEMAQLSRRDRAELERVDTYITILDLSDSCIADLRRESIKFATLLQRWQLPIVRKLFLKNFAMSSMLKKIQKGFGSSLFQVQLSLKIRDSQIKEKVPYLTLYP